MKIRFYCVHNIDYHQSVRFANCQAWRNHHIFLSRFVFFQGINSLPVISNLPLSTPVTIQENSALSTSVFQVAVTDVDVGQTHTYQLYCSPSIGSTLFYINSSSQ